ncbi:MAG TPA: trimethylamine methyltransferase family protein [Planctomycetota bacterium]|nr:trimethylamine methyltransferase family protein [Planctomycetota bacterium]HRR81107.1 trimethylamine methyltransferase family protein [Planctomycetota bacterium]HRT93483.1 trimethylamine methyltransferase family protein [Planctomycetota bacterium]
MRIGGPRPALTPHDEQAIHRALLRLCDEVGLLVESPAILDRLAAAGARVDRQAQRARLGPDFVERFIGDSARFDWDAAEPSVAGSAGVYHGYHLDPDTGRYEPWTLPLLLRYLKLAHHLEHTNGFVSVTFGIRGVPSAALEPFLHYLAFKLYGHSAAGVTDVRQAATVLDLCEAAAAELGDDGRRRFRGVVYLVSPLKLGHQEADVFTFFAERGIATGIGHMLSLGGTAPVTLAGALALNLAQDVFTHVIHRAYFGGRAFGIGCAISPLDMRTGMYCYGRPEQHLANVALAQMARRYGVPFWGHCGSCDAKRPSAEAGFQKALGAMACLMASGHASIATGLLSVDEVFSPVQMVIDDEIVGALKRFARGFEVNDETLAFDLIRRVGPGGGFLDAEHTVRHFRGELWEPLVFAREMLAGWQRHGSRSDADVAREVAHELMRRDPMPSRISDALERRLLAAIRKATNVEVQAVELP